MASGGESDEGYAPYGGLESIDVLKVSPEQRMIMRNIPFFVLPESKRKKAHVRPKINSHNPSYVPAQVQKRAKLYTQKVDYSHVHSRIDSGSPRLTSSCESPHSSLRNYTPSRSRVSQNRSSSPSYQHSKLKTPQHSISPSSRPVRLSSSADYSHIKSRIDVGRPRSSQSINSESKLNYSFKEPEIDTSPGRSSTLKSTSPRSSKPDYGHIKSRIDSGHKSSSMSSGSMRSTGSMSSGSMRSTGSMSSGSMRSTGSMSSGSMRSTGSMSSGSMRSTGSMSSGSMRSTGSTSSGSMRSTGSMSSGSMRSTGSMSRSKARAGEATATRSSRELSQRLSGAELLKSRERQIPLSDPTLARKARSKYQVTSLNNHSSVASSSNQRSGNTRLLSDSTRLEQQSYSLPQHSDRNRKSPVAKIKSRIDCSDPNPAVHKLKHSLEELTIPLGSHVNPRFGTDSESPTSKSRLVKSSSFHTADEVEELRSSASSIVKSSTFDSLFEVDSGTTSAPHIESEIETAIAASTTATNPSTQRDSEATSEERSDTDMETLHHHRRLAWGNGFATNGRSHIHNHNAIYNETLDRYNNDSPTKKFTSSSVNRYSPPSQRYDIRAPYYEERIPGFHKNTKLMNSFGGKQHFELSEQSNENDSDQSDEEEEEQEKEEEGDLDIVDFEVTSSEIETTVFLKHLLAQSSLREEENETNSNNDSSRTSGLTSAAWAMPSIEESDSEESENYYESEDAVIAPTMPLLPYTGAVPTVNLVDEDGSHLEMILQGREALSVGEQEELFIAADTADSSRAVKYTPQTVYDDYGPSTKL